MDKISFWEHSDLGFRKITYKQFYMAVRNDLYQLLQMNPSLGFKGKFGQFSVLVWTKD